ncbi:MAG: lasso peptide isopeptide bond-forming cyclase [Candidatus Sumerlaeota bacterium]|nr:lasso peptide isopeptide bond-forming cyclase [Candidatus Sumerlaeota bacterium]
MSAIAGIYNLDGRPAEIDRLAAMGERAGYRGPDGAGRWQEGPIGLEHRLLWTTPQSRHERLPRLSRSGNLAIASDARIDNRDELARLLGLPLPEAEPLPDSEFILMAYEKWGEGCPERLLGDFAFAIWDRRARTLFCARDAFGVRSFYYFHLPRHVFAFASEIKMLHGLPEAPRRLNEEKVADYLQGIFEDKSNTFYQGIFRLPPAHRLVADDKGVRLSQYWAPDPTKELRLRSDQEYGEAYRETLTEAVRCRMRSAYPLGSMLSGGMDSSSITCVARDLAARDGGSPLHTFSGVFDEVRESDERPFIEAVLEQGGVEPHFIRCDQTGPLADMDRLLWHEDEPFYAPNLHLNREIWEAARGCQIRVLLDGFIGDTAVSHGYSYLNELAFSGRWVRLGRELRALGRLYHYSAWKSWRWHVWHQGLKPLAPESARRLWRALRPGKSPSAGRAGMIQPEFARRIGAKARARKLLPEHWPPARTEREQHYRDLTSGLIPAALEAVDKAAAPFGLEPRFPFLDRRVVEFCLSLPPEQKLHGGWARMIVRRGLAGCLPEKVRWRSCKGDMGPSFRRGLLTLDRDRLSDALSNLPTTLERYVNREALREIHRRGLEQEAGDDELGDVWLAVLLAKWWPNACPRDKEDENCRIPHEEKALEVVEA